MHFSTCFHVKNINEYPYWRKNVNEQRKERKEKHEYISYTDGSNDEMISREREVD